MRNAFEEIIGQPIEQEANITGRTETAIFAETLRLHGIEPTAEYHSRNATILARLYDEHTDLLPRMATGVARDVRD